MLLSVHVKNLALIDEVEMNFENHLNILTGETGAGKSVLMGAVNMALGGRISRDMIRKGADYALAELFFSVSDERVLETLKEMEIPVEDDSVIISRRMTSGRSVSRINGEIVSAADVRRAGQLLLDIHGQHDHQSLLDRSRHLTILDRFIREPLGDKKERLAKAYQEYMHWKDAFENHAMDNEQRLRQMAFIEFEIEEIENARLTVGEDEQLEADYLKMSHGRQIIEGLSQIHQWTGYDDASSAGEQLGRGLKNFYNLEDFDPELVLLREQLENIESLLNDFNRDLSGYMDTLSFDEQDFRDTEDRLDLINRLKAKYGATVEDILNYQAEKQKELDRLKGYDEWLSEAKAKLSASEKVMKALSGEVSGIRKAYAAVLEKQMEASLKDLNFLQVRFEIKISPLGKYTKNGSDDVEFLVSTNPGEDVKPLGQVASGGELSRIMLGIKSVLAEIDEIPTLIFDEIDTGISGRTAQKVAEKMAYIGRSHQVLCITHLPQIAAMADSHYLIEKTAEGERTQTRIRELSEEEQVREVGRLMGGVEITQTILDSADEMKKMAEQFRKTCLKN
ncbi:DNA repair protein RecN [Frisingicoccus caecimuris]|uniref:DNA repair protein RecN n=1 Tax=Frisingicoccus caecimuris TaxID=1796636 RepID=A0A4R2LEN8_9FIRM|nr:DNA repair protein RecN [Frisingicoccus caecimuris]MCR1917867.1 DNA repair protein RecN [Frisingicoccus caecimuris]TCO86582.1 DNA repair protein RecN (Recombination protein N) [Frisingicoccus caecimuris]